MYDVLPKKALPYLAAGADVERFLQPPLTPPSAHNLSLHKPKMLVVCPEALAIPSNDALSLTDPDIPSTKEAKVFINRGPSKKQRENKVLYYNQDVLAFYNKALVHQQNVEFGITTTENAMQGVHALAQHVGGGQNDALVAKMENLVKRIFLFFALQKRFWGSKHQDMPFLVLSVDGFGQLLVDEVLYLPSRQVGR